MVLQKRVPRDVPIDNPKKTRGTGVRYLHLREGIYYFRRYVPPFARDVFGTGDHWETLETGSLKEARERLAEKVVAFDRRLKAIKGRLEQPTTPTRQMISAPSRHDMDAAVRTWMADWLQRSDPLLAEQEGRVRSSVSPSEAEQNLHEWTKDIHRLEVAVRSKGAENGSPRLLIEWNVRDICERNGWDLPVGSAARRYLTNLVGLGQLEYAGQAPAMAADMPLPGNADPLFAPERYAADAARPKSSISLHAAMEKFLARPSKANDKTKQQYRQRLSTMIEALGKDRALATVTREDCRRLLEDVILKLPKNQRQRFKGMTVSEAIVAAEATGAERLNGKSVSLMLEVLKGFFQWCVDHEDLAADPSKALRISVSEEEAKRHPFNTDELVTIFAAPLYRGCVDDGRNYATPGPNLPRGHRFWLPLVALFSGMRIAEICQLKVSDFETYDGLPFFDLRRYQSTGRTLKNPQSARRVPVHDELVKLGLIKHVASQPTDAWLFDGINRAGTAAGSDAVSKWFGRFLDSRGLDQRELVFHSFRHAFRDGLADAGVDEQWADKLGGWSGGGTGRTYGGGGSTATLDRELQRLRYPGLDLTALHQVE
jgi:integrase